MEACLASTFSCHCRQVSRRGRGIARKGPTDGHSQGGTGDGTPMPAEPKSSLPRASAGKRRREPAEAAPAPRWYGPQRSRHPTSRRGAVHSVMHSRHFGQTRSRISPVRSSSTVCSMVNTSRSPRRSSTRNPNARIWATASCALPRHSGRTLYCHSSGFTGRNLTSPALSCDLSSHHLATRARRSGPSSDPATGPLAPTPRGERRVWHGPKDPTSPAGTPATAWGEGRASESERGTSKTRFAGGYVRDSRFAPWGTEVGRNLRPKRPRGRPAARASI